MKLSFFLLCGIVVFAFFLSFLAQVQSKDVAGSSRKLRNRNRCNKIDVNIEIDNTLKQSSTKYRNIFKNTADKWKNIVAEKSQACKNTRKRVVKRKPKVQATSRTRKLISKYKQYIENHQRKLGALKLSSSPLKFRKSQLQLKIRKLEREICLLKKSSHENKQQIITLMNQKKSFEAEVIAIRSKLINLKLEIRNLLSKNEDFIKKTKNTDDLSVLEMFGILSEIYSECKKDYKHLNESCDEEINYYKSTISNLEKGICPKTINNTNTYNCSEELMACLLDGVYREQELNTTCNATIENIKNKLTTECTAKLGDLTVNLTKLCQQNTNEKIEEMKTQYKSEINILNTKHEDDLQKCYSTCNESIIALNDTCNKKIKSCNETLKAVCSDFFLTETTSLIEDHQNHFMANTEFLTLQCLTSIFNQNVSCQTQVDYYKSLYEQYESLYNNIDNITCQDQVKSITSELAKCYENSTRLAMSCDNRISQLNESYFDNLTATATEMKKNYDDHINAIIDYVRQECSDQKNIAEVGYTTALAQCLTMVGGLDLVNITDSQNIRRAYYISGTNMLNWTDANAFCRSHGMRLLCLDDQIQLTALNNFLINQTGGVSLFWSGMNDAMVEGQFTCDGSPVSFTQFGTQPPDGGTVENCVALHLGGNLTNQSDEPCARKASFICDVTNPCDTLLLSVKQSELESLKKFP